MISLNLEALKQAALSYLKRAGLFMVDAAILWAFLRMACYCFELEYRPPYMGVLMFWLIWWWVAVIQLKHAVMSGVLDAQTYYNQGTPPAQGPSQGQPRP